MGLPAAEGSAYEGDVLCGKYRLEKLLGRGGMGSVFRARNVLIGREVAVKVLREEHAQNPALVTRFLREAQAANLVRHPNAVDVLDIGQDERGRPFIVQELLFGEDLAKTAAREDGKLPVHVVLRILLPILDALAVGHANGVVHRDLKPDNVFLARYGSQIVPKLLDFGISQIHPKEGEEKLTQVGAMIGTPQYMSPEQVRGGEIDARADVWSIGVVLYELIAGRRPFTQPLPGLYVSICGEDPAPLEDLAPGVPPAIAAIVRRCLERDREKRFADAGDLQCALDAANATPASSSPPASSESAPAETVVTPPPDFAADEPAKSAPPDEPVPDVPSLPPPPPPPMPPTSKPAPVAAPAASPAPAAPLAPPVAPTPFDDDMDDDPRPRNNSGISIDYASAPPPRTVSYARLPEVHEAPKEEESAAPLVAAVVVAVGAGAGLIGSFLGYNAMHLEVAVARIQPDAVRLGLAFVALAVGVVTGTRAYRGLRDDVSQGKLSGAVGGLIAAVFVFVTLKLLAGG